MTRPKVALCIDPITAKHPETLGLDGEDLSAQSWLEVFTEADVARKALRDQKDIEEVWVLSCEDVAPINLAATLKQDEPSRSVCVMSSQETGSLCSRARAAGLEATLSRHDFIARYGQRKSEQRACSDACGGAYSDACGDACGAEVKPLDEVLSAKTQKLKRLTSTKENAAFLISVVSGSGGAGKSTIAALMACLSQTRGFSTLLLDFDLQFGDMASMLGLESPYSVDEILETPARIETLVPEGLKPAVLAAPPRIELAESVSENTSVLLDIIEPHFEVVVANTGAAWADQHAVLLERSAKSVFLIDQRPSSLRACRHALDLCARLGIATSPFIFALNRCSKAAPFTPLDVSCAFGGTPIAEFKDGGFEVESHLSSGSPLELIESGNDLCVSIDAVLSEVLPSKQGEKASAPEGERPKRTLFPGVFPKRKRKEPSCH